MYQPEPIVKKFYDGLDEGIFLGRKCPDCGSIEFPPVPVCNKCGKLETEWVTTSGEVIIDEVYKVLPAFVSPEFNRYLPLFCAEASMEGGSEFSCVIFGVTDENYIEVRDSVPLKGNLVVMPHQGEFNSFAVSINGAVPNPNTDSDIVNEEYVKFIINMDQKQD